MPPDNRIRVRVRPRAGTVRAVCRPRAGRRDDGWEQAKAHFLTRAAYEEFRASRQPARIAVRARKLASMWSRFTGWCRRLFGGA